MKKLTFISVIILSFMIIKPAISGEVTDTEWSLGGFLIVTYYNKGGSCSTTEDQCTKMRNPLAINGPAFGVVLPEDIYSSVRDTLVQCTAFSASGSAIGGGSSANTEGGITRVIIETPTKYVGKDLRVECN